jgi:predicted AlkP superfamily phosphohydrolase/phosphomutase
MENGVYGNLRSSDPVITIPAWMVMVTGKTPGKLGVYGFRHRKENSHTEFWIANSHSITEPRIWDLLGEKGLKSIVLGIPPTFPVQPINGHLVSCFLTPGISANYTYPSELKQEISDNIGEYIFDVNFRTNSKEQLLMDIYKMSRVQFDTVKYLMKNKEWDYFHFVIIGLDRIHHAFWKYYDKKHQKYEKGNLFESVIKNYYKFLDAQVGELLALIDKDTTVFIVSDHGVKSMKGCLCINMALEQLGLLRFKQAPNKGAQLEECEIDWQNTYAWGWGGYYARIFLNVKGREEFGIIDPKDYEAWREKLITLIKGIPDDRGNPMDTKVYRPEDLYEIINGDAPDLMVYFDDLNWRSAGTLGYNSMYLDENDTGPDDAVHDYNGIFIISKANLKIGKHIDTKSILDITPTILKLFGIEIPEDIEGHIISY